MNPPKQPELLGLGFKRAVVEREGDPAQGWLVLGWFGTMLTAVGFADFVMVFIPSRFGDPTWEFGVVDAAFSSLPVLTIGLGMSLASLHAAGSIRRTRVFSGICVGVGAVVAAAMVLYLTNVPIALRFTPPELLPGIQKSIARTFIMGGAFAVGFIIAGISAWRRARVTGG